MKTKATLGLLLGLAVTALMDETQGTWPSIAILAHTHKDRLLTGEPLIVTATITNIGSGAAEVFTTGHFGRVFVRRVGEPFRQYLEPILDFADPSVVLQPGGTVEDRFVVLSQARFENEELRYDYTLGEPGTYYIEVRYEDSYGLKVRSDPLPITVVAPTGEDERVWQKIRALEDYRLLMETAGAMNMTESSLAEFEKIVADHPKSVYMSSIRPAVEKARYWNRRPTPVL